MSLDNNVHFSPIMYLEDPYRFNFFCCLVGIALYVIGYLAVYYLFIKVYPEEQEQYYLTSSTE